MTIRNPKNETGKTDGTPEHLISTHSPIGPINYPGMTARISSDGIQAHGHALANNTCKPSPWRASWIWLDSSIWPEHQTAPFTFYCEETCARHRHTVALFRREIHLDATPNRALTWVSADVKYQLYVNGALVGRGPAAVGGDWGDCTPPRHWFYDHFDLTPWFVQGPNVICAKVALQGYAESDFSMGKGGFLFEAHLCDSENAKTIILSDNHWKGIRSAAFIAPDIYDASKECTGWMNPGFDDGTWSPVQERCPATEGPWNLMPREIPPLIEALEPAQRTEVLDEETPYTTWFDFPHETVGHFQFTVRGTQGTHLVIAYQELPGKTHRRETYILRDGEQSIESPRLNAFQRVGLEIDHATGPVKILSAANSFSSYPVTYRGSFECQDDFLNRLWKAGRWTTQLCMQTHHLDSPVHQEPLGCTGDYLIEALINYQCFHEPALIRQDLKRTELQLKKTDGVMFHTSYSLLWIQMLLDYYDYTSDESAVHEMAPTVHRLLRRFRTYKGTSGLITEAPNYMFMDWTNANEFELHHPPCSIGQGYMTMFYLRAFQLGARAARITRDETTAAAYESEGVALAAQLRKELWQPKAGLYCDGHPKRTSVQPNEWLPADSSTISFSLHMNALAAANGLADAAILERALDTPNLPTVQPYFMHFVFDGLKRCGIFGQHALELMRKWAPLLKEHPSTLKENWKWGDYSHAWSGTPTYQLSARVLGITPKEPGFRVVRIEPIPCGLSWARGSVPLPHGDATHVEWRYNRNRFVLETHIPENSQGHIILPNTSKTHSITLNGNALATDGKRVLHVKPNHDSIDVFVSGGTYRFVVE